MAEPKPKKEKVTKYYFSRSAKHRFGGFKPESYFPSGKLKSSDRAIQFSNHWFITDEPAKQRFVESQGCFGETIGKDGVMVVVMNEKEWMENQTKHVETLVKQAATSQAREMPQ